MLLHPLPLLVALVILTFPYVVIAYRDRQSQRSRVY